MHPVQPSPRRRRKGDSVGDPVPEALPGERNVMVWTTGPNGPEPHSAGEIPASSEPWSDSEKSQ